MCGIYCYCNYMVPKPKRDLVKMLINGLQRLEYRGYDSSGLCLLNNTDTKYEIFKSVGKVRMLDQNLNSDQKIVDLTKITSNHIGIAHTRWATHGKPCVTNSHPIPSDKKNTFIVVHNGIISNHADLKKYLECNGYVFETDTDTECAAKLALFFYEIESKKFISKSKKNKKKPSFIEIVKKVIKHCTGAYAFIFVSHLYPGEVVAVRKSSPMLIGVKTDSVMQLDFFDVNFGTARDDQPSTPLDQIKRHAVEHESGNEEKGDDEDSDDEGESEDGNMHESETGKMKESKTGKMNESKNVNESKNMNESKNVDESIKTNESKNVDESIKTNESGIENPTHRYNTNQQSNPMNDVVKKMSQFNVSTHTDDQAPMEVFIASDASAVVEHTQKVIFLEDDDIAHVKSGKLMIHRPNSKEKDQGPSDIRKIETLNTEISQIMKGNFDHYMLKEIFEQTESVVNTMRGRINFESNKIRLAGLIEYLPNIRRSHRLIFIACGTSYHSSLATRALFEEMVDIPVSIELASDFVDRKSPIFRSDCVFFISQSGETADTILGMKYCASRGALCVGITNTVGSTISRETTCGVHINAGPEIGVASTKAYSSQYIALVLIALQIGQDNKVNEERVIKIIEGLRNISNLIKTTLELDSQIREYARNRLAKDASLLILGRGYQHATCLEGALKIKEVAYIHAEGILTGELKHGPLALIDETVNVLLIIINDGLILKTENAVQQILARKGKPFIVCTKDIIDRFEGLETMGIPKTVDCLQGLLSVIPLQLLSYHLAVERGYDVDCPRNLAKSVTVE